MAQSSTVICDADGYVFSRGSICAVKQLIPSGTTDNSSGKALFACPFFFPLDYLLKDREKWIGYKSDRQHQQPEQPCQLQGNVDGADDGEYSSKLLQTVNPNRHADLNSHDFEVTWQLFADHSSNGERPDSLADKRDVFALKNNQGDKGETGNGKTGSRPVE